MAGYTYSSDFSLGGNGYDPNYNSDEDCWLMKFNPFASNPNSIIVYSTYFGGHFDDDMRSMVVDANGVMYFGGTSLSPDLPTTSNAYQATLPNTSANLNGFVAIIDTNQAGAAGLIYCSFFGGSDNVVINGVATYSGQVYATGWTDTPDLPTTGNVFQAGNNGAYDSFVAVFNPALSTDSCDASATLVFSSYLGGYAVDVGRSIDVDSNGLAYVTGYTFSSDFPVTGTGFQQIYNDGGGDAFVTQVDPVAGAILYSTFLGGTGADVATKVQVQPSGHIAVTGYTFSDGFPAFGQCRATGLWRKWRRVHRGVESHRDQSGAGLGVRHLLWRQRRGGGLRSAPRFDWIVLYRRLYSVEGSARHAQRNQQRIGEWRDRLISSDRESSRSAGLRQLHYRTGQPSCLRHRLRCFREYL